MPVPTDTGLKFESLSLAATRILERFPEACPCPRHIDTLSNSVFRMPHNYYISLDLNTPKNWCFLDKTRSGFLYAQSSWLWIAGVLSPTWMASKNRNWMRTKGMKGESWASLQVSLTLWECGRLNIIHEDLHQIKCLIEWICTTYKAIDDCLALELIFWNRAPSERPWGCGSLLHLFSFTH